VNGESWIAWRISASSIPSLRPPFGLRFWGGDGGVSFRARLKYTEDLGTAYVKSCCQNSRGTVGPASVFGTWDASRITYERAILSPRWSSPPPNGYSVRLKRACANSFCAIPFRIWILWPSAEVRGKSFGAVFRAVGEVPLDASRAIVFA
jgi:hypothetical protein